MRLTIAIPTYNRNQILAETLRALLPQITPDCQLLIIDNCSNVPVAETLEHLCSQYPCVNLRLVRNPVNIGAPGNGVRCFELCETDWMWLLGDDDVVSADAVQTILSHIDRYPEALFFSFASPLCERRATLTTVGLPQFISAIDDFSNVMFMSASTFRVSAVRDKMAIAHRYAYSCAPHFALLLVALADHGQCCFSAASIIDRCMLAPEELRYSALWTSLGLLTLVELVDDARARTALASHIIRSFPPLRYVTHQLCLRALKTGDIKTSLYLFDQVCSRVGFYQRGIRSGLYRSLLRVLVRFPRPGVAAISWVYRILRGKELPFGLIDRDCR